jgi:hypothetical protein
LFPAPSGSGKSTLVTALLRDGYDYLSDDIAGVSAGDPRVWPFPLGINLKRGSRDLVALPRGFDSIEITGEARRDRILMPPSEAWEHPPTRLYAVVFPQYAAGAAPKLERLTAIDALTRLLTDRVHLGDPLTARRISRFLRWVELTPFYALSYCDLTSAHALIEGLLP